MRVFVPLLIILVLVIGALIALRMIKTANHKRSDWNALSRRATFAEVAIDEIKNELSIAQQTGQMVDPLILSGILREYDTYRTSTNIKEIS